MDIVNATQGLRAFTSEVTSFRQRWPCMSRLRILESSVILVKYGVYERALLPFWRWKWKELRFRFFGDIRLLEEVIKIKYQLEKFDVLYAMTCCCYLSFLIAKRVADASQKLLRNVRVLPILLITRNIDCSRKSIAVWLRSISVVIAVNLLSSLSYPEKPWRLPKRDEYPWMEKRIIILTLASL
jgi:hypothetical protein